MKKLIAIVALFILGVMPMGVYATDPESTLVNFTVSAGVLSLTAPATVNLGAIIASTLDQTVPGTASDWVVDDARGKKAADQVAWSLTVTATDFSDGVGSAIDVTNLTATPSNLEKRNGSSSAYTSYGGTDVTLGAGATLADTGDDGISDPINIATAGLEKGKGNWRGDVGLSLLVPADSDAAAYESTLTFTVA